MVAVATAAAIMMGATACGTESEYVDVMQYAYYDSANVYHSYVIGRQVYVKRTYYEQNPELFQEPDSHHKSKFSKKKSKSRRR